MKTFFLLPLLALTVACHGGMHGNPSKRIDWVAKRIESKLDLTAAQKPAFDALVARVKTEAEARMQKHRDGLRELKTEVDKPALDIDRIATLAKTRANDRLSAQDVDGFIDQAAAFLKQLSPDQQKKVAELVRDKLDWLE